MRPALLGGFRRAIPSVGSVVGLQGGSGLTIDSSCPGTRDATFQARSSVSSSERLFCSGWDTNSASKALSARAPGGVEYGLPSARRARDRQHGAGGIVHQRLAGAAEQQPGSRPPTP